MRTRCLGASHTTKCSMARCFADCCSFDSVQWKNGRSTLPRAKSIILHTTLPICAHHSNIYGQWIFSVFQRRIPTERKKRKKTATPDVCGQCEQKEKKMCNRNEATCGRFLFQFIALNMTNVTARYILVLCAHLFQPIQFSTFRLLSSTTTHTAFMRYHSVSDRHDGAKRKKSCWKN